MFGMLPEPVFRIAEIVEREVHQESCWFKMKRILNGNLGVGFLNDRYPHMKIESGNRELEIKYVDQDKKEEELRKQVTPYIEFLPRNTIQKLVSILLAGEMLTANALEFDEPTSIVKRSSVGLILLSLAMMISPFTRMATREASNIIPKSPWKFMKQTMIFLMSVALVTIAYWPQIGIWPSMIEEQIEKHSLS